MVAHYPCRASLPRAASTTPPMANADADGVPNRFHHRARGADAHATHVLVGWTIFDILFETPKNDFGCEFALKSMIRALLAEGKSNSVSTFCRVVL